MEDLAVERQRHDALLDAGAGAVVDADERAAGLDGQVHDLDDLLAVYLAEAASNTVKSCEKTQTSRPSIAVAGHDAVAERFVLAETEVGGAVACQRIVSTNEPSSSRWVIQLARSQLVLGVNLFHRSLADWMLGLFEALAQIGELTGGRVDVVGRRVLRCGGHGVHANDRQSRCAKEFRGRRRWRARRGLAGIELQACPIFSNTSPGPGGASRRRPNRPGPPTPILPQQRRPGISTAACSSRGTRPPAAVATTGVDHRADRGADVLRRHQVGGATAAMGWLSLLAGVAVADALARTTKFDVTLG